VDKCLVTEGVPSSNRQSYCKKPEKEQNKTGLAGIMVRDVILSMFYLIQALLAVNAMSTIPVNPYPC
jgi:hypothetical protein